MTEPATAAPSDTAHASRTSRTRDAGGAGGRRCPTGSGVLLTIAAVSAVLVALWSVINIVILVLMAAVLAIGLDPAVRFDRAARAGPAAGR